MSFHRMAGISWAETLGQTWNPQEILQYISLLVNEHLRIPQEKLGVVMDEDLRASLLDLSYVSCLHNLLFDKNELTDEHMTLKLKF